MAESVQYYLERMIPELEGLEKKNIFSHVEIKSIIKKRTNFEYALQRRIKQKIDFLRAIEYEINLEDLRKKRVTRMGIAETLKGSDLQYSGARRIYNLFRRATIKFTGDLSLWLQYIDYAKRNKANNVLSSVFVQAIQYHPNNASLWIMAASWENEHNANMAAARVLLQRALRLMPENQQLWHEYFRLELIYIEKIKLRRRILGIDQQKNAEDLEPMDTEKDDDNTIQLPAVTGEDVEEWNQTEDAATSKLKKMTHDEAAALEEANNPILQGLLATIIYDNAITAIPQDIEFRKQFVSIYGEFTDTQKHIEHVFETIRRDMMQDPAAVAFLATRHLGSLPLSDPAFIPALRQCVQDFEQSLTNLPQPEMWLQYIQFLQNWFDLVSELNLKSYLSKQLLKTFKSCHKQHHDMNVALFEAWTHHLVQIGNTEKADDIATQGLEHYPSSVALWLHRIQLSNEDHDQQRSFYVKALDLNPASLTLWTSYKNWILKEKEEETDTLLWQACTKATALLPSVSTSTNDRNEIKDMLQTNYVAWTAETKGIEKARDVYKKIILHCYPTRAFFMKCVEVEGHYGEGDEQGQASVEYLYDRLTRLEQDKEGSYISYLAYLYSQKKLQKANQMYHRAVKEVLNKEVFDLQVQKLKSSSSL